MGLNVSESVDESSENKVDSKENHSGEPCATLFKNFFERDKPLYIKIDDILKRISGNAHKDQILELRSLKDEYLSLVNSYEDLAHITYEYEQSGSKTSKERRVLRDKLTAIRSKYPDVIEVKKKYEKGKNSLMNILFSGKFTKRYDDYLIEHSGYVILDFDEVENPEEFRDDIFISYKFIRSAFVSPSGKGVKALVRVPRNIKAHRGHFQALKKEIEGIDPSGINESRICYVSFDPDIKIRSEEDTEEFSLWEMPEQKKVSEQKIEDFSSDKNQVKTDYSLLTRVVGMIRNAVEGERNVTLLKAARLAGGYIASKKIRRDDAFMAMNQESKLLFGAEYDEVEVVRAIENGIEYGFKVPIHELEAEASIDENTNSIISISDVYSTIMDQYHNGIKPGSPTYLHEIDRQRIWSRKEGRVAVFVAPPEYGKSEFIKQIYLLQAIHEGAKSIVYSPEETETEFYTNLLHTLCGAKPEKGSVPVKRLEAAIKFVKEHIFYLGHDTKSDPDVIFANFTYFARNKEGVRNFCIDPITKTTYASDKRDDKLLGEYYTRAGLFAHEFNCNFDFGAHPRPLKLNADGEYPPANIYDISGGGATANFVHDVVVLDRPEKNKNPNSMLVDIYFRKVKNKSIVGRGGMSSLKFNIFTNRYLSNDIEYMSDFDKLLENPQMDMFNAYIKANQNPFSNSGRTSTVVDRSEPRKEQEIEDKSISISHAGKYDPIAEFESQAKPVEKEKEVENMFEPVNEDEIPF